MRVNLSSVSDCIDQAIVEVQLDLDMEVTQKEAIVSIVHYVLESLEEDMPTRLTWCICLAPITLEILERGYCSSCMRGVTLQIGRQPNDLRSD